MPVENILAIVSRLLTRALWKMALNPSRRGFAVARRRLSLRRGQGEKAGFEGGMAGLQFADYESTVNGRFSLR
ncbi:MAG: hypothetical protein CMF63_06705 [Magnetovibrio sp.]|nr:hypothetical protein [Magnetovibrio sp.]